MKHYELTYTRKSAVESEHSGDGAYSEGHFRTIKMWAASPKAAREIAEERLASQFPDEDIVGYDEDGEPLVVALGQLAQSNYEFQGCVALKEDG